MKKIVVVLIIILLTMLCVVAEYDVDNYYNEILTEQGKKPDKYITRGEFVSLLMKTLGYTEDLFICSFYDIYETDWEYKYIANAEKRKIVTGDFNGAFSPDSNITVGDAITVISRAYKITNKYTDSFSVDGIKHYSEAYIQYSCRLGLYPKENEKYINALLPLKTSDAISIINGYAGLSKEELEYLEIKNIKLVESGKSSAVRVNIKTTKPCNIYYKIIELSSDGNFVVPDKHDINKLFSRITDSSCEVSGLIKTDFNKEYNIYFVAKDERGFVSDMRSLIKVSSLPYVSGNGTAQNPYKIHTKYQLEQMRNYPDKHFLLCADIEYNGEWEPIGNTERQENMFSGVLDGQGYGITGLIIQGEQETGFISCLFGGIVRNLYIDAEVSGNSYVGVIAGKSEGGTIENCHVTGSVTAKGNISGGIVGKNNGIISSCVSAVYFVEGLTYSGGITGHNTGTIEECISAVEIVSADMHACAVSGVNVGGIIKSNVAAVIEVSNVYTGKTGIISTNRDDGRTIGNYSYLGMISDGNVHHGINTQDGDVVTWDELTGEDFYTNKLKWDFKNKWTFANQPEFMLPMVRNISMSKIINGRTVFSPKVITHWEELQNIDLFSHYILGNNIHIPQTINKSNWKPIGMTSTDYEIDGGLAGTFDGNGYTISGIRIYFDEKIGQYGLFAKLTGSTVRNLKITDCYIEGINKAGILTAINYGTIENCSVSGEIKIHAGTNSTLAGGICATNYTSVVSSISNTDIDINTVSATAGGISAHNEGYINECAYNGKILSRSLKNTSNSIIGGVVGANYSGYVYNCYACVDVQALSYTNYCGGIVGLQYEGEIYKCSSMGKIHSVSQQAMPSYSYSGGICGLVDGGLIMNSFSKCNITVKADKTYNGGILGYCSNASVQNTYSQNSLNQIGKIHRSGSVAVYSGGIIGFSENSNISSNVAINQYILTNGYFAPVIAYSSGGFINNNYCYDKLYSDAQSCVQSVLGEKVGLEMLTEPEFYFKSPAEGGKLNWSANETDRIWKKSFEKKYSFPTLYDVKNQDKFDFLYKY